jgi:riboflavin kinase/FMN adenylyltransferase
VIEREIEGKPQNVGIIFVEYLRENQKFDDLSTLKQQIKVDIERAKAVLGTCKLYLMDFL